jgi:hypothetical protein
MAIGRPCTLIFKISILMIASGGHDGKYHRFEDRKLFEQVLYKVEGE